MFASWQNLSRLIQGKEVRLERVRLVREGVALEGDFELPPLATLSMEDQVFVATFVRTHGSIKEMERLFGVSYPSIKNRLNKISEQLDFIEVEPRRSPKEVLTQLEKGEISVKEALEALKT